MIYGPEIFEEHSVSKLSDGHWDMIGYHHWYFWTSKKQLEKHILKMFNDLCDINCYHHWLFLAWETYFLMFFKKNFKKLVFLQSTIGENNESRKVRGKSIGRRTSHYGLPLQKQKYKTLCVFADSILGSSDRSLAPNRFLENKFQLASVPTLSNFPGLLNVFIQIVDFPQTF